MRPASWLLAGVLLCAPCLAFSANTAIKSDSFFLYLPCNSQYQEGPLDHSALAGLLEGSEFIALVLAEDDPTDLPSQCTVDQFLGHVEVVTFGIVAIDTHGGALNGSFTVEFYETEAARSAAYAAYTGYVKKADGVTNWEICQSEVRDLEDNIIGYGIDVSPYAVSSRMPTVAGGLVVNTGCGLGGWMEGTWPGASCWLGNPAQDGNGVTHGHFLQLFLRMSGEYGKSLRSVSGAVAGGGSASPLSSMELSTGSSGDLVLAPSVVRLDGPQTLTDWLGSYDVEFDTIMDTSTAPAFVRRLTGSLSIERQTWLDDTHLRLSVHAYEPGTCDLEIGPDAVAADTDPWYPRRLDGNTAPPNTDGHHPSGDSYIRQGIVVDYHFDPSGTYYAGAYAYRSGDSAVVSWISDPEWSTRRWEVFAPPDTTVLATLPPAGSTWLPHYYETSIPLPQSPTVRVRNVDSTNADRWLTPPITIDGTPPPNLSYLRELNALVATWPPFLDATACNPAVPRSTAPSPLKDLASSTPDFLYYSSRQDFLDASQPIRDWWFQNYRQRSITILGSSDPTACREALRPYFEQSLAAGTLPHVVLVGEAHQTNPSLNIVGMHYYPSSASNACGWTCASDAWLVDFDDDSLPDLPWSRVVCASLPDLNAAVSTALDWYRGVSVLANRALVMGGTRRYAVGDCPIDPMYDAALEGVRQTLAAKGLGPIRLYDSDLPCDATFLDKQNAILPYLNEGPGVREVVSTGVFSNRAVWPGYFIQTGYSPPFSLSLVTRPQRLVMIMPGCDIADADRPNPSYPSLAKLFLTGGSGGPSAVALLGHLRFGHAPYHSALLRRILDWRFSGATWTLQQAHFHALRDLAATGSAAMEYCAVAGSLGWPVNVYGQPRPPTWYPGGGGCPHLELWQTTTWTPIGSVLSSCAYRSSDLQHIDVRDRIEIPVDATGGSPLLQLRLAELSATDEAIFNAIQLRVLDYPAALPCAVTTVGRAIQPTDTILPSAAILVGDDRYAGSALAAMPGDSLLVRSCDSLTIVFADTAASPHQALLSVQLRGKPDFTSATFANGGVRVLGGGAAETLFPRKDWSTFLSDSVSVVRGDGLADTVRFLPGESHWLRSVQLVVGTPIDTPWRSVLLRTAAHSVHGDVLPYLRGADSLTSSIEGNESLTLSFYVGSVPGGCRRTVLCEFDGRYHNRTTERAQAFVASQSAPRVHAFPNPIRGTALIVLENAFAPAPEWTAEVYAVDGRRIRRLQPWRGAAALPAWQWDGRDDSGRAVPSGVYFVRVHAQHQSQEGRVVIVR